MRTALTGNYSVAYAAMMARVKVVAAYPITPQTSIIEKLSEMIESGRLNARMIRVESEHSALASTFGAAVAGARVFTATSSHGLLYMHEWVHWTSRARIPVVMAIVTRALAPPWNIWPDHSDFMDQRDAGWIMAFAMDNQEAFDLTLQGFKISEDPRVYLPYMVGLEGFILGHTVMPVDIPEQERVDEWLGPRRQPYVIDPQNPIGIGNMAWPEDTEEMFMGIQKAMERAKKVIVEVDKDYGRVFGRSYGGLISCYRCEDAKYHIVIMGAWSGDAMEAVNNLREEGVPIGVLRIRYVRPFPSREIVEKLGSSKGIIVFDRSISFGSTGPLYQDVVTSFSLHRKKSPYTRNIVAGIGGVNITYQDFEFIIEDTLKKLEEGSPPPTLEWYHRGGRR